ncbi:epoxyqueuosine reductase QueH [Enterobacter cloacae]|uniref:epoxyqueuosine reductase QueH n=1 Tax=Enterobacter cloacae TaxID=550 RepID=UPI003BEF3BEC
MHRLLIILSYLLISAVFFHSRDFNYRKHGGSNRMIEIIKREQSYKHGYCSCLYSLRAPLSLVNPTAEHFSYLESITRMIEMIRIV